MFAVIRVFIMLIVITLALVGVGLLLILWHIKRHPLSLFYWFNLLRHLPG